MKESILRDLLERLASLMRNEQRAAGIEDQLQPVHQNVLHYLTRCNRYSNTPAAVSEYLQITKGTASQSIQVLERRGFILKKPDKEDGRVVRLRLSASGQRLVTKLRKLVSWDKMSENFSAEDLITGEIALTTVLRGLQQKNKFRTFGQCYTCHNCRHHGEGQFQCGLTGAVLQPAETKLICREHKVKMRSQAAQ